MLAVETIDLRRVYKSRDRNPDVVALDDVSIQIEEGEIRGLLGPNGAGKTTLVKILSTVLLPTSGSAFVLAHDVVRQTQAVRQQIGIVFGGDRGSTGGLRDDRTWSTGLPSTTSPPASQSSASRHCSTASASRSAPTRRLRRTRAA